MIRLLPRRLVPLALALAATASLSACTTFSDDNVAARVGDTELSNDDLATVLRGTLGDDAVFAPINDDSRPDDAGDIVTNWIIDQLLRKDLAAAGIPVAEPSTELNVEALLANFQTSAGVWSAQPTFEITEDEARDLYNQGIQESNIVCVSTILIVNAAYADGLATGVRPDDATVDAAAPAALDLANEVRAGIVGGEQTFDQVAQQYANGERTDIVVEGPPCMSGADFIVQYSENQPEYVDAVLQSSIGEVSVPVAAPYGVHLLRVTPFDEILPGELDVVLTSTATRFDFLSRRSEVYVDPRFGTFNGPDFLVPLG